MRPASACRSGARRRNCDLGHLRHHLKSDVATHLDIVAHLNHCVVTADGLAVHLNSTLVEQSPCFGKARDNSLLDQEVRQRPPLPAPNFLHRLQDLLKFQHTDILSVECAGLTYIITHPIKNVKYFLPLSISFL